MRTVIAGSVLSTALTLEALVRHGLPPVGVLSLDEAAAPGVSGFLSMADLADRHGLPCRRFRRINDPDIIAQVRDWKPDLLFVVGLSQLVGDELLNLPVHGCVGFHPTRLPRGRGRAPIAWLTLRSEPGAATFFRLDRGADSGPIYVQEPYGVSPGDSAADVIASMERATVAALDRWLPRLRAGDLASMPQDDSQATFYGARRPEDGILDWHRPAPELLALVRAASRPHPGAYTFLRDHRLLVWRAEADPDNRHVGVPGRVLEQDDVRGCLVQAGAGAIWLREIEWEGGSAPAPGLRVGVRLGYDPQEEIHQLRRRVAELEALIRGRDPKCSPPTA